MTAQALLVAHTSQSVGWYLTSHVVHVVQVVDGGRCCTPPSQTSGPTHRTEPKQ